MKLRSNRDSRGFALVVTISLVALLAIITMGFLSLSTVTLRNGSQDQARIKAQANARMALQIAIGELQEHTGPDQRITITADQLAATTDGKTTAAHPTRRHWCGVYKSWTDTAANRPTPEFQRWLVSAPETDTCNPEYAKSASSGSKVEIVGMGTVGDAATGLVDVPLIDCTTSGKVESRYGWWVGDQGVKAPLSTPAPGTSTGVAATRQRLQSSPRTAVELATTGDNQKPFATVTDTQVRKLISWKQGELLTATADAPKPLFHDLAIRSTGLLTNVCRGGFRKDLSMRLEQPLDSAMKSTALYTAGSAYGINQGELWTYYNLYKELKTGGNFTYTSGGLVGSNTLYLQTKDTLAQFLSDPFGLYKQPTIVSTKIILSFWGLLDSAGKIKLYLVLDPIITYWNPLDVPLVITPAWHTVKFWQLPYNIKLKYGSSVTTVGFKDKTGGYSGSHYLSFTIGRPPQQPVVLRPGEVVMFSDYYGSPNTTSAFPRRYINAKAGWDSFGGMAYDLGVTLDTTDTLTYEILPNHDQSRASSGEPFRLTGNNTYYKNDNTMGGESYVMTTGLSIDTRRVLPSSRLFADENLPFFDKVPASATRPLAAEQLLPDPITKKGGKAPFMIFSYTAKTEQDSDRPGRFLVRYNPSADTDFQTLTPDELETLPYEVRIEPLNSWKNRNFEVSTNGRSYFGGGLTADTGTSFLTTHSVPREPLVSLAAFQNSFANGFAWDTSNNILNLNSYLLPQISHAIGNSIAPAVIDPYNTESALLGPRPLADHSYLANKALWDDWFLSSAAPQTAASFTTKISQREITQKFIEGSRPLPNSRYLYDPAETTDALLNRWFDASGIPTDTAVDECASAIRVEGMFNVNSTSVEAWRTFLTGLRNQQVAVRNANGVASLVNATGTPVLSLQNPEDVVAEGIGLLDVVSSPQWVGHRVLKDTEIDELARAIVVEVRKRGPFLSLADFVNRRPGSDKDLAKAGTLQAALDSSEVSINKAYNNGPRAAAVGNGRGYAFPEAENGPAAYGIPGVVKQADILTPIAPYLSARSDTFVIRGYGESLDSNGKVIARAWCEAEVTRDSAFVDPVDESTATPLSPINQLFGRRYQIVSFRWLHPSEV